MKIVHSRDLSDSSINLTKKIKKIKDQRNKLVICMQFTRKKDYQLIRFLRMPSRKEKQPVN